MIDSSLASERNALISDEPIGPSLVPMVPVNKEDLELVDYPNQVGMFFVEGVTGVTMLPVAVYLHAYELLIDTPYVSGVPLDLYLDLTITTQWYRRKRA